MAVGAFQSVPVTVAERTSGAIERLSDGAGTGWQPTPDRVGEKETALRSGRRKYSFVLAGVGMIIGRPKRPRAESSAVGYLAAARIRQSDVRWTLRSPGCVR